MKAFFINWKKSLRLSLRFYTALNLGCKINSTGEVVAIPRKNVFANGRIRAAGHLSPVATSFTSNIPTKKKGFLPYRYVYVYINIYLIEKLKRGYMIKRNEWGFYARFIFHQNSTHKVDIIYEKSWLVAEIYMEFTFIVVSFKFVDLSF